MSIVWLNPKDSRIVRLLPHAPTNRYVPVLLGPTNSMWPARRSVSSSRLTVLRLQSLSPDAYVFFEQFRAMLTNLGQADLAEGIAAHLECVFPFFSFTL